MSTDEIPSRVSKEVSLTVALLACAAVFLVNTDEAEDISARVDVTNQII